MAQDQEFVDFEVEGDFENTKPMEGGKYDLVAEGTYKVEVINLKQDESSTNKPMVTVEYVITNDQDTDEARKFSGQHLWQNYFLTTKALGRLVTLMKAAKAPLDKFRASAILGAQMYIDVVHNVGNERQDAEGNTLPARTFANVCKERALDGDAAEDAPPPPPVAKGKTAAAPKPTTGKPANSAPQARRA